MMPVTTRNRIAVAAVVLLVALNLWRWWPSSPGHDRPAKAGATSGMRNEPFRPEDFSIRALPAEAPVAMQRDIFRPKPASKPAPVKASKTPVPPPKTPEEQAREAAEAELALIRCIGVAFRGNRASAFLAKGGESQMVSPGDKFGGRFVVDKITPEAVTLKDPETGVGGTLTVSGKQ